MKNGFMPTTGSLIRLTVLFNEDLGIKVITLTTTEPLAFASQAHLNIKAQPTHNTSDAKAAVWTVKGNM